MSCCSAAGWSRWVLRCGAYGRLVGSTRRGRVGVWLALAGVALLGVFIIQVLIQVIRTGEVPQNFVVFALGFLLTLVGHLLFARDLRPHLRKAWVIPLIAAAGAVVCVCDRGRSVSRHWAFRIRGSLGRAGCRADARTTQCWRRHSVDLGLRRSGGAPTKRSRRAEADPARGGGGYGHDLGRAKTERLFRLLILLRLLVRR
jgi:hypothetical protein